MEILGDLKKFDRETSQREVRRLADKLVPVGSSFNVPFRGLIELELKGHKLSMDGRAVVAEGKHVISEGGEEGIIAEVSPTEKALLRWQVGDFEMPEQILAAAWRQTNVAVNLEEMQRNLGARLRPLVDLPSLDAVVPFVEGLIDTRRTPELYGLFLHYLGFHLNSIREIMTRLTRPREQHYSLAFPYTTFCLRAATIFAVALAFGHVTTHHNTLVDLEYLFYIPFCDVFSSGDKFHRDMAPYLLSGKQEFIWHDELKTDLKGLSAWWDGLNEHDRAVELERPGPPENDASRAHLIWRKLMGPGYHTREKLRLTPEQQKGLVDHIRKLMDTVQDADGSIPRTLDDKDFVVRKRMVRPDAPCFCGSKRIARDCCFLYLSEKPRQSDDQ